MADLWTPLNLKRPPIGLWTPRDTVVYSGYIFSLPNRGSMGSALDLIPTDGGNPVLNPNGFGTGFPSLDFDGRQPLRAKDVSLTGDTYIIYTVARVTTPSKSNYLFAMGDANNYAFNSDERGIFLQTDSKGNSTLTVTRGGSYYDAELAGGDAVAPGVAFIGKGHHSPKRSFADKNAVHKQPVGDRSSGNFKISLIAYGGDTINFYSPHLVGSMGSGVLVDYIPTQDEEDQIYGWLAAQDNQQANLPVIGDGGGSVILLRRRPVTLIA